MNSQNDRTSIPIVDDHTLLREGLREILQRQDDMRVASEAADSATAVALAAREQPDIVLLDIEIPGGAATSTVSEIRSRSPGSDVIILSMYEGPQLVQALLTAGIRGYLLKSIRWQELVVAIRAVRTDRQRVVLGVSRESLRYVRQGPSASTLSDREREVLALVAEALRQWPDRDAALAHGGHRQAASQEHIRQARGGFPYRRSQQGSRA